MDKTDRMKQLEAYTVRELVDELMRRKDELDSALAMLGVSGSGPSIQYVRKSVAKAAYWREWHDYKVAHPGTTIEQWRRLRKRTKK